jgi:hypothetical protein
MRIANGNWGHFHLSFCKETSSIPDKLSIFTFFTLMILLFQAITLWRGSILLFLYSKNWQILQGCQYIEWFYSDHIHSRCRKHYRCCWTGWMSYFWF